MQPPNAIDCQVADEDMEAGINDQMMQDDSVPFCFESFQSLKGRLHSKSSNEQLVENQVISSKPIENGFQQSFQVFHDPIANVLDDVCSQSLSPLTTCEFETCADIKLDPTAGFFIIFNRSLVTKLKTKFAFMV